jgi:hypothetical protein
MLPHIPAQQLGNYRTHSDGELEAQKKHVPVQ